MRKGLIFEVGENGPVAKMGKWENRPRRKWAWREGLIFGLGKMGPKMGLKARLLPRGAGRGRGMAKSRYIGVVLWWLALTGQFFVKKLQPQKLQPL